MKRMNIRWHYPAFVGLAIAAGFLLIAQTLGHQGYHTFRLFGSEFGLANIKSHSFVVWADEMFRFPFQLIVLFGGVIGVSIAAGAVVRGHFKQRKPHDEKLICDS